MNKLTSEQRAAVDARGKVIVSASAGSGKTFVMIEKLVEAILGGADLDGVLAVTFTKKAAAQMKEKLRSALIAKLDGADAQTKSRLKVQLSKISSADISTIHSFCSRLIRTYFYCLGVDSGFDIISSDDATARDLKTRAFDNLFNRLYESGDSDFKLLLKCFSKKRSDNNLKKLLNEAYSTVRTCAHYTQILQNAPSIFTEDGFEKVCADIQSALEIKFNRLICAVERFRDSFPATANAAAYNEIFEDIISTLRLRAAGSVFDEIKPLTELRKPTDAECDKAAGESFKKFRDEVAKRYKSLCGDFEDEDTELERFLQSGKVAAAFSRILIEFDAEYAAVMREENKLDYNDLEHLTLKLVADDGIRAELNAKYKYVFVDEYQDVNPVQEEIISAFGGEVFLVGDVKQAIYGFRGSKPQFFAEKYAAFGSGGSALKLTDNFRSSEGVINFVNAIFSSAMTMDGCGIDYARDGKMRANGAYPAGYGRACIEIFGKDEPEEKELQVYSVKRDGAKPRHTREGLAVLAVVERELQSKHFDLKSGGYVDTQPSDICILTRKNKGGSAEGIVRALTDAGYSVAGAQEANVCLLPEVKQFLDVLSLIDNAEQDVPLVSALLSPLGNFCEDELAAIRIAVKDTKLSFRECCKKYLAAMRGEIARKLNLFYEKLARLRELAKILPAGELADEILETYGLEEAYGAGGGEKIKNILRVLEEGAHLPLCAFLNKLKAGGFDVGMGATEAGESIKVMTMHAAKGLEFPVVIVADICRTFKGADYAEMPFDESYGFAPKCYDLKKMLTYKTALGRLLKLRSDDEELKNELNLFYVACTRAMCNLYVLAEEAPGAEQAPGEVRCYAQTFDARGIETREISPVEEFAAQLANAARLTRFDDELVEQIEQRFMREYAYAESVNLPVKSSASALLKEQESEQSFTVHALFGGEGETGTERGKAYHRYLQLCDFTKKDVREIADEIKKLVARKDLTAAQAELLNAEELGEILSMPVFADLNGATLYREREFLCRIPANEVLSGVTADDHVLIQGAIDLIAEGEFGVKIIDYKYSVKDNEALKNTYARQLELYKKAVSKITRIDEKFISCTLVNIYRRQSFDL